MADICLCVHMLLSGAVVESAHWPLTVDVVAMVKVACSRHPVPYSYCCYVTALLFFLPFVSYHTGKRHIFLTLSAHLLPHHVRERERVYYQGGECSLIIARLICLTTECVRLLVRVVFFSFSCFCWIYICTRPNTHQCYNPVGAVSQVNFDSMLCFAAPVVSVCGV